MHQTTPTEKTNNGFQAAPEAIKSIRKILEDLAKHLVDKPDDCSITYTQGEQTVVYEVRVAAGEIGKIVGKKGAMAEALRTILKSLAAKNRIRAVLEIVD